MHFEMGCYYFWQADILNHHCDYDIVIMFKRKHLNGVSISTYDTLGLGEAFVSGEGVMGTTFKDMFEAFCEEYGDYLKIYSLSWFITLKLRMIKYLNCKIEVSFL